MFKHNVHIRPFPSPLGLLCPFGPLSLLVLLKQLVGLKEERYLSGSCLRSI